MRKIAWQTYFWILSFFYFQSSSIGPQLLFWTSMRAFTKSSILPHGSLLFHKSLPIGHVLFSELSWKSWSQKCLFHVNALVWIFPFFLNFCHVVTLLSVSVKATSPLLQANRYLIGGEFFWFGKEMINFPKLLYERTLLAKKWQILITIVSFVTKTW